MDTMRRGTTNSQNTESIPPLPGQMPSPSPLPPIYALEEYEAVEEDPSSRKKKIIILCILIAIAALSLFVFAGIASNPETYGNIFSTLDEKKGNVMGLVATTTSASAAVTLIPGDVGTPIADKLADFSTYFMVILAVIYLEKMLLPTLGFFGIGILVPIACILFAIALFRKRGSLAKVNLQRLGTKFAAFGLAIVLIVPVSVWLTDSIDSSFEGTLAATNEAAQQATQELEASTQGDTEGNSEENQGLLEGIAGAFQNGINGLSQGAQDALTSLQEQLNIMIDTLSVMIVTSCLIPLLVLFVFFQLFKIIAGLDFGKTSDFIDVARAKIRPSMLLPK